ncbi:hypothetical protein AB0L06_09555 [Spirillospora sp. NPDC052269]
MRALHWEDLPEPSHAAIEARCGTILKAETTTRGIMPGLAARLDTIDGGRFFLKAVSDDSPARELYLREEEANAALAASKIAPTMLWSSIGHGWVVMVFEYIEGREADLSPGSPDLPQVVALLRRLGSLPAWQGAPPVTHNVAALRDTANALLNRHTGADHWEEYAQALDRFDLDTLAGGALVHYDLSSGNLLGTTDGTKAVDWSFACAGAAWLDAVLLLPRLIEAGHTPAQAEAVVAEVPAWDAAPADSITGLATLWTMFREYKAFYGPKEMRNARAQAADAGRAWVKHRTH